jgi:predicted nucleic acid-binding protein
MNAIDTNVLVYALDRNEPIKRQKARDLLRQLHFSQTLAVIPWQVAGEFLRWLRFCQQKGQISEVLVELYLRHFIAFFPLRFPNRAALDRAIDLFSRFSLSHWDSMLLGACAESGVTKLYTEDMGSPRVIDTIQLVNPFI